tara:strand:+ start:53 stop:472 length:420 start_codon:yes stop_codon:yes gene_type:complete
MQIWVSYAILAAVFISIRDILQKKISEKFSYIEYVGYATILTTIGVWSYIFANNIQLKPLDTSNLLLIVIRVSIAYLLVEPALFYCFKNCKNTGEAASIISMNVLFAFILSLFIFNATFDMKKLCGIIFFLMGAYFITN